LVVIYELLVVSIYRPNEFISSIHAFVVLGLFFSYEA